MASKVLVVAGALSVVFAFAVHAQRASRPDASAPASPPAQPTAPATMAAMPAGLPPPAHNLGPLLASTSTYDLYEYRMYNGWCTGGNAALSVVFKVDANFVIQLDDAYKARFSDEILPVVKSRCPTVRQVTAYNFVSGVVFDSASLKLHPYAEAASVRYERPLNNFTIPVDPQGQPQFPADRVQYSSLAQVLGQLVQIEQAESLAASNRERLANEQRAAAEKLAATTRTPDGALRLEGFEADHKDLFLKLYDQQFIPLIQPDTKHYRPYQMYTALIQGFDDFCHDSLVEPVQVDFYRERRVDVFYTPFMTTEYWERYLSATVFVDKRYESAYRSAHAEFLTKFLKYYKENLRGENLVQVFQQQSLEGVALAEATHKLVMQNDCRGPGLKRFMDVMHTYVTDNWTTLLANGDYRYYDNDLGGTIERLYERTAPNFSPPLPVIGEKKINLFINRADEKDGLRFVVSDWFDMTPWANYEVRNGRMPRPPAVDAAIAERRYQVATCTYVFGDSAKQVMHWNANATLPSAEVQAWAESEIGEPLTACPPTGSLNR